MMNKKLTLFFYVIFIITHIINLEKLPIFEDEALYLFLSDKISSSPLQFFFIYPQNGLLPMFGWLISLLNIFFQDSLITGRLLNVLLASTLIFWVVKIGNLYKLDKRFQLMSIILLIISPIIHLNSRVALLDISVLVFTAWYIYFTLKYLRVADHYTLYYLFFCALAAFLTKATSIFGLLPVIFLIWQNYKKNRILSLRLISVYVFAFITVGSLMFFFGTQISEDSGSSLVTHKSPPEILNQVKMNIFLTYYWAKAYYLPFFFLPVIYLLFHHKIKNHQFYLFMVIWIISSIIFMVTLNRFYYPRHILILSLPLIVFTSALLTAIPKRISLIIFIAICLIRLQLTWNIIANIYQADLALEDRFEYFENYTSGINLPKIASFLTDISKDKPITLWVDGSYVLEYGLRRELKNNQIIFKSYKLGDDFLPHPLSLVTKGHLPTYVLTNKWQPLNINELNLIKSFDVSFRHTQRLYIIP